METRIAFATYQGFPSLTDDDRLAAEALARRGIQVEAALWTDSAVDWSSYSAVVIRSCWDYHLKADEFRAWLDRLGHRGVSLWNPYEVVRWNMDKTYLNDLQGNGIPMLDSVWLPGSAKADLSDLMRQKGWGQAVVKPMISAAANDTDIFPLEKAGARQRELVGPLKKGGVIVQDFAEEITSGGEGSLIFFNRKYSHALIKRPQEGDFRVQRDFGGTAHPIGAPNHLVQQAKKLLDTLKCDLLYARVDGVERNRSLYLMELDLIEPHLCFEMDSHAAHRFASALIKILSARQSPVALGGMKE